MTDGSRRAVPSRSERHTKSWALTAGALLVALLTCCAEDQAPAEPAMSQVAPGSGDPLPDVGTCERLPPTLSDSGACQISWSCANSELKTFACFNDETGMGCACREGETFGAAFTEDVRQCGDAEALAALARKTCAWEVP